MVTFHINWGHVICTEGGPQTNQTIRKERSIYHVIRT